MARTLADRLPMGIRDSEGKPVVRKSIEAKPDHVPDEAAEHRAAMLAQAEAIARAMAQNAELLKAVMELIDRPPPVVRQVDAWEFTIERDTDGLAKKVYASPRLKTNTK